MTILSRSRSGRVGARPRPRPRAVWAAFVTSSVVAILVVAGVLVPVLTLISTAAGFTAGALRVPAGQIAVAIVLGSLASILLLVLCVRTRSGPLAWVLGVAAVVSIALVSVWPLVAVATSAVGQAQDVVPFIRMLVDGFLHR